MRYYYSYEEFRKDLKNLCQKIEGWEFDAILAIARGGMTMAHMMGEYFNKREVLSLNSIGYEDNVKLKEVKIFNIPELFSFKRVLIVDDIIDSGESMDKVLKVLKRKYDKVSFKTAVIFQKENALIKADFWVRRPKAWIDFFWSEDLK